MSGFVVYGIAQLQRPVDEIAAVLKPQYHPRQR